MRRYSFSLLAIVLPCLLLPQAATARDWRFDDVERVVAISDIHGAYDAMVETLQNADVLDDGLQWVGGGTHLVIVGDILDRGPKSRAAMDLLMRLEDEAPAAGGQVHVLIGNHESMLLTGDYRYVSGPEYAAFAAEEQPQERERWFEHYVARRGGSPETLRAEFDRNYPVGYFAMRRAFRPDGPYGRWLLDKNIIAVINGTAFVHGGLSPVVADIGIDGVNGRLQQELADYAVVLGELTDAEILLPTDSHYDYPEILRAHLPAPGDDVAISAAVDAGIRLGESSVIAPDGPLWYRNNAMCPGIVEQHRLQQTLDAIGVRRVVVGHTPTPGRQIVQRFGGRLLEIDTGMLNFYYKGSGNALVLEDGSAIVIGQSGAEAAEIPEHPRRVGHRADGMSTQAVSDLLQSGEIVSVETESSGGLPQTLVRVSDGTHTIDAIFSKRGGRGFYPGVAAYRLDRLLALDMVPVTVRREVDGDDGSLQFLPANRTDEAARAAAGAGGGALCAIPDQWSAMYVFDVLIYNQGRSQRRMLYDRSTWALILSEHERAFAKDKGRPAHLKNFPLNVTPGWKAALATLSDDLIADRLSDVLDKKRQRALAVRRDELLATD